MTKNRFYPPVRLEQELQKLVAEGAITEEVHGRLLAACRPEPSRIDLGHLFFRVLVTLGVLMLALAIFLLVGFNWKYLSPTWKLTSVFTAMLTGYVAAFTCRYRAKSLASELLFFGSCLLYGVGIWQVGQVFNLPSDYSVGLALWSLGTLLVAIWMRSPLLHFLTAALLAGTVVMDLPAGEMNQTVYGVIPLLLVPGFIWSQLHRSKVVATMYLLILYWWGLFMPNILDTEGTGVGFLVAWSGLFCLLASFARDRVRYAILLTAGLPVLVVTLLITTFYEWNNSCTFLASRNEDYNTFYWWQYLLVTVAMAVMLIFVLTAAVRRGLLGTRPRWTNILFSPAGIGLISSLVIFGSQYRCCGQVPLLTTILTNILFLAMVWWMVRQHRLHWFWPGVLSFLAWSLMRYLDLFGDFGGMPGAAALFAFLACVLFVAAWYSRRHVSESDHSAEPAMDEQPVTSDLVTSDPDLPVTEVAVPARTGWLVLAVLFQFAILGNMVLDQIIPFKEARLITVTPVPVDPRDLFRGDYVILRYSFSQTSGTRWNQETKSQEKVFEVEENCLPKAGDTVYTTLRQNEEDGVWSPVRMSNCPPTNGEVFLKGRHGRYWNVQYGIESFYVQEGHGRDLERTIRGRDSRVLVDLLVAPDGRARIKDVRITENAEKE